MHSHKKYVRKLSKPLLEASSGEETGLSSSDEIEIKVPDQNPRSLNLSDEDEADEQDSAQPLLSTAVINSNNTKAIPYNTSQTIPQSRLFAGMKLADVIEVSMQPMADHLEEPGYIRRNWTGLLLLISFAASAFAGWRALQLYFASNEAHDQYQTVLQPTNNSTCLTTYPRRVESRMREPLCEHRGNSSLDETCRDLILAMCGTEHGDFTLIASTAIGFFAILSWMCLRKPEEEYAVLRVRQAPTSTLFKSPAHHQAQAAIAAATRPSAPTTHSLNRP